MHHCTYTPDLSTLSSSRSLTSLCCERSIRDPFFLTVYVKDTAAAAERALELGQYYTDEEAAVYAYGKDKPYPLKAETDGAENPAADGTGEPGAAEAAAGPDETGKPEASEA